MTKSNTIPDLMAAEPFEIGGETALRVALTGPDAIGEFAIVDHEGLEALVRKGARALYLVGDGHGNRYVTFLRPMSRSSASAARVIVNCPGDRRVTFLNGDRFDLRTANLSIISRRGETVGDMAALKAERLEQRRRQFDRENRFAALAASRQVAEAA